MAKKDGSEVCFIQVKSCHPDRSSTFLLRDKDEAWVTAPDNQFVIFAWLGSPSTNDRPKFWITSKREAGLLCTTHGAHGTANWERRLHPTALSPAWLENWEVFRRFMP